MNQLVCKVLSWSQEGKRRVIEWISTPIREGPQETKNDTNSTTDSLMFHNDHNKLTVSSSRPEETGSTASLGGAKDMELAASSGGPNARQARAREEMIDDNSRSNTENANEILPNK